MSVNSIQPTVFVSKPLGADILPLDLAVDAAVQPLPAKGDTVVVDGKLGIVENVKLSPYWPEEREGLIRCFVVSADWDDNPGNRWVDWCLPGEVVVLS